MLPANPTRTPETMAQYQRIVRTMERHAEKMKARGDIGEVNDPNLLLAIAFHELEPWISASTSRMYKAAVLQEIKKSPTDQADDALNLLQPEESERTIQRDEWLVVQRKTNLVEKRCEQQRATHLSPTDWQTLLTELQASSSPYGIVAAMWLAATRITGLRPCEWQNACRTGPGLIVRNAKATNGRAHGKNRTLNLLAMPSNDISLIDAMLNITARGTDGEFRALYHRVRDLIADAARKHLNKRTEYPSLYTARHMFASAAKSAFTQAEVAALMGHGNIATAPQHYAAARYAKGRRQPDVRAADADINAVQRLEAARAALRKLRRAEGGE
jgi:hypothetical protein